MSSKRDNGTGSYDTFITKKPNGTEITRYRWSIRLKDINGISKRYQITSVSRSELKEKVNVFLQKLQEQKSSFWEKLHWLNG